MEREAPWTFGSVIEPKVIDSSLVIITKTTYKRRKYSLRGCGRLSELRSITAL